jgi:MoaA/NifB/PqqE/SkfB family radical SAM enzyme
VRFGQGGLHNRFQLLFPRLRQRFFQLNKLRFQALGIFGHVLLQHCHASSDGVAAGDESAPIPRSRDLDVPPWEGSVAEEFSTTFCNRPFSEIMVRDQNEVLPCPWHEKPLGLLSEGKSLAEIFEGEAFQRLRRNMLRPEGDPACANCPIKSHHLPTNA